MPNAVWITSPGEQKTANAMIPIQLKRIGRSEKPAPTPVLDLSLPALSPAPRDTMLNDARKCARWLERLPRANIGEVSRHIFNAIIDFNRIEMPAKTRLRVAELFPPEVGYIVGNLEKYYVDSALPLSRKNRKIAILCRELYLEMALSYKLIVDQLVNQQRQFDQNLLIVALHRAIHFLGLVHQQSALHYEVPPPGCWSELHKLYTYAAQNHIDGIPVRMTVNCKSQQNTIESLYLQACTLSICAPHQLTNAQLRAVLRLLPEWAEKIDLRADAPPPSEARRAIAYAVDLFSDAPPTSIEAFETLTPRHHLVFDCAGFVAYLRKRFSDIQPGRRRSNRFRLQLHRQIIGILRNAERNFVRTELHFELNMVKGLGTLYRLLTAADESSVENEYSSVMTTRHLGSSTTTDIDSLNLDSEELFQDSGSGLGRELDSQLSDSGMRNVDSSPFFTCQTANESASGYCLIWPAEKAPRIKVGELLGIQSPTRRHHYSIAVVRWLTNLPGSSLRVGIEIVSPLCIAARLAPRSINRDDSRATAGLLLPEIASASQDNSVLLPAAYPVESRILIANTENERFTLKLTLLMESTPSFNRYEYQRISDRSPTPPNEEEDARGDDEVNNGRDSDTWTLL